MIVAMAVRQNMKASYFRFEVKVINQKEHVIMELSKSSRHSKITGDFGEALVLYWLSKYGFECAFVDHTGIDIIAKNTCTGEVMGISVKSRSRNIGKETTYLTISNENFDKATAACEAFGCVPYFAIVVDAGEHIRCYRKDLHCNRVKINTCQRSCQAML